MWNIIYEIPECLNVDMRDEISMFLDLMIFKKFHRPICNFCCTIEI